MDSRSQSLWRHADFLKLWAGQSISAFGSQVTAFALPLIAVNAVGASAVQMGALGAVQFAPMLLLGLVAGAWVDHLPRRRVMIAADVGRALLLASIPLAATFDRIRMAQLYAVGFLMGCLSVLFQAAHQSYLPALVGREHLVEGNGKLGSSQAAAQMAGPSLGGLVVQWLGAPVALVADAVSFIASALFLLGIRAGEERPGPGGGRGNLVTEIVEGLRFIAAQPVLRSIAVATGAFNLFATVILAIYYLFVNRELGVPPAMVGALVSAFGVGALGGSLLAGPISRRLGIGPAIVGALMVGGLADALIPLAGLSRAHAVPLLLAAQALIGLVGPVYSLGQLTLQQALTPDRLRGRVNASIQFIGLAMLPVGSLVGGWTGKLFGLQAVLGAGAAGTVLVSFWLLLSPVKAVRALPARSPDPGPTALA